MSVFDGLIAGFQGGREAHIKRQQEDDANRRAGESRVFEYLMGSQDPEMRALALSGLLESASPGKKGKGLSGYMGEIQAGQFYPQILARMNEEVPDEGPPAGGAGTVPPVPGSAAMSTNQPVRAGSQPLGLHGTQLPPEPQPMGMNEAGLPMDPNQGLDGVGAPPPMSQAPPVSKWKRRGTGVPTAEEIAESSAAAGIRGRMGETSRQLHSIGAPPPMIQRALLGIAGAPPQADRMIEGDLVILPGQAEPVSTMWINGKQMLGDGVTPVPPGAHAVAKSTAAGMKSAKEPDPSSPTGWVKVFYDQTGQEVYRVPDTPFIPAPAYAGTTEITDPNNPAVPVRAPINRGGGVGPPLGDVPTAEKATTQTDAEALVAIIDRAVQDQRIGGVPVRPGIRDQITTTEARKLQLPYTTYAEAIRAAKSTAPVTKRQQSEGGSTAERVRQQILKNRQQGGAPPPVR